MLTDLERQVIETNTFRAAVIARGQDDPDELLSFRELRDELDEWLISEPRTQQPMSPQDARRAAERASLGA